MKHTLFTLIIAVGITATAWFGFVETSAAPQGSTTLSAEQTLTIRANGCALKVTKNTPALIKVKCVTTTQQNSQNVQAPTAKVILTAGQKHTVKPNQCTLVIARQKAAGVRVRCDAIVTPPTNTPTTTSTPPSGPLPDLIIQSIALEMQGQVGVCVPQLGPFLLRVTIKNIGTANAGAFVVTLNGEA